MVKPSDDLQMLIGEIRGGSIEAFDAFYEQLVPFVFRIALKTTGDKREAEDVCHDVFLEVYRRPNGYEPSRGSVKAWLAVKTRSRCLDRLRKKQRVILEEPKEQKLPFFADKVDSTEELVFSKVEREVLKRALERIPEAQRQALHGKYFDSRTQNEIADEMSRPVGTVKSLIRYGIRNVRRQLRESGWADSSPKGGGNHEV
ncbi:MAG TPA: RNA polymerase sigma factor [Bacillales bacterium]|nr:RNA polymerase sigma factor [Bacillales bacterium]